MSRRQTLLVVDDNPVNLQLLVRLLTTAGYRVLIAEDGESALEQAAEAQPDLVLMDVLLPGMNGFDTCRELHARPPTATIPVIFLTALSRTSDKVEGFRAGGVDYLTKPLQFEEVLARIRVHLDLRRLQAELRVKNDELEERDRRRERLLSIIAHDLKSPMATFVNATRDLSRRSPGDPDFGELIAALAERAERMDRFLETLLEWGRLQVESGEPAHEEFELQEVVRAAVDHVSEQARSKGVRVEQHVPNDVRCRQNATALRMVLINLATNAIKFTPSGGRVRITAADAGDHVEITVRDTGVGMSEAEIERLFRADRRLRRTGTAGEQGAGLGLLLSRDLVGWMSGTLSVSSRPDDGSEFRIELPTTPIAER
ncbi:MAG: response regulator [Spirochaetota bacterium]